MIFKGMSKTLPFLIFNFFFKCLIVLIVSNIQLNQKIFLCYFINNKSVTTFTVANPNFFSKKDIFTGHYSSISMQKRFEDLAKLSSSLKGNLHLDVTHRIIYSTDASAYREEPLAVAFPKNTENLTKIVQFCSNHNLALIPRAAGTSLAGQVVGTGIVVDISKHFKKILEVNPKECWVKVEPGVILDELNLYIKEYNLFFGPETSTSNRCTIGGMIGNNSCGSHSLKYGSTRDHLLEVKMMLNDGSIAHFKQLTAEEFENKTLLTNAEGSIYRNLKSLFDCKESLEEIEAQFPDKQLRRRNTGYALDLLTDNQVFGKSDKKINVCSLIAGSEGTLGIIVEAKLNLVPLPPKEKALICVHLRTLEEALHANLVALRFDPTAIELMDQNILELTKDNIEQRRNRFFVDGDPAAILIIELAEDAADTVERKYNAIVNAMITKGYGYHYPIIKGTDINKVWNLRKAGLGVLSNLKGDAKPVSVIEDTAVIPEVLPDYIRDFQKILDRQQLSCVYHAHIGTGELHLRPILNLKNANDVTKFRSIAYDVALLVKQYRGSLSGEHGDGRLRGEFIPLMVGEKCYRMMQEVKRIFDPKNIFNPNKIVDTPPMSTALRFKPGQNESSLQTFFDFSDAGGYLRAIERCNGSGDCRKTILTGGVMCPSFMATGDEDKTTRARANMLREIITNNSAPFKSKELYQILDLCLSCKGCKSECPSSVDIAKLKAEFLQHYFDNNGIPLRSYLVAKLPTIYKLGSNIPSITNLLMQAFQKTGMNRVLGFTDRRQLPLLYHISLSKWYRKKHDPIIQSTTKKEVVLFNDEFTNYLDVEIGIKAISLLNALGYKVIIPNVADSGRTYLSKGLVRKAKELANTNIEKMYEYAEKEITIIGIEPSAILSFRDEYPDLAIPKNKEKALKVAQKTLLIDEFLMAEMKQGFITTQQFTSKKQEISFHGHCQQKSIATTVATKYILEFPTNYTASEFKTGCCGMAGSFGYEKEHHSMSMAIGELALFPAVRKAPANMLIAAPGTSCRHHIYDGTGKKAYHPIEILFDALLQV